MQDFFFHKVLYSNLNRIFQKIAKIFQLYAMKNKFDLNLKCPMNQSSTLNIKMKRAPKKLMFFTIYGD